MVTHLPPGMAGLLNALYWGDPTIEEELEIFSELWDYVGNWHDFTSAYAINEDEKSELENIGALYIKVNDLLDGDFSLEVLVPPVYEAFQLMESVNQRRKGAHFSPLPAINELLMAGAAFCTGEGESRGVEERLALAEEFLGNYRVLAQDYRRKMRLDDTIRAELKKGFTMVEEGLKGAALGLPDPEAVADALAGVKGGASIIEVLAEWDRERSLALRDTHTRFKIPQVGDEFEMALNGLQQAERSKWNRHIKYFRDIVMVQLEDFVAMVQPSLLLPNDVRHELWERLAEAIEFVHQAVDDLESEEFEDADAVQQFEDAAVETSNVFADIDAHALKDEHLVGRPEGMMYSAIRGILTGSVPDAVIPELCASVGLAPEVTEPLDHYMGSRDPSFLFDAAEALVQSVPSEHETTRAPWTCEYCGQGNAGDQPTCSKCQGSPAGRTV
jgi:hypothetical protein